MAWYFTDQVKSNQVFKKIETLVLYSVKICMAVDKPITDEVD